MKIIKIAALFLLGPYFYCAAASFDEHSSESSSDECSLADYEYFFKPSAGSVQAPDYEFKYRCCNVQPKTPILFLDWDNEGKEQGWDEWVYDGQGNMKEAAKTIFSLVTQRPVFLCKIVKGDDFLTMKKAIPCINCCSATVKEHGIVRSYCGVTAQRCYLVRISKTRKLIVASYMHENQGPTRCFETGIHLESPAWIQELSVLLDGLEEPAVQEGLGDPAALWDSFHGIPGSGKNAWERYI